MKTIKSTPKADGYYMPAEFETHERAWMLWPERTDNWRNGAKPAQKVFTEVAKAIRRFEPITVGVSDEQYSHARSVLPDDIRVVELSCNDSWIRDCGPTFVVNDQGGVRTVNWDFNAWGGLYDGLYFPWDKDDRVASKISSMEEVDMYKAENFVLEGGSITVDGEGTLVVTEQCLLSPGRNPHLNKEQIEENLKQYLGVEKIIWLKDGMDPDETNGHVDDVCCFARPGEVVVPYTEDQNDPWYKILKANKEQLEQETDAKGRKLKVHTISMPKVPVYFTEEEASGIDIVDGTIPRIAGEMTAASYLNYLYVNGGIIVPQFGDENDAKVLEELRAIHPDREVVGVLTHEIILGGGNVHCITQQQPKGRVK